VLDLGCGSGIYSLWFAERGAQVTGLDLSTEMIELARAKAGERNLQLDLRVADIGKPFELRDDEFDLIFTGTALHYIENLESVMREAARVMRPGAVFIASVPRRTIETPWLGYAEVSSEGRTINCYHHTISEYFSAFAAAGLTIKDLAEPRPPDEFIRTNPARYWEALQIPIYLVFRAVL
jgi:SAM-dependent methyltransferase